MSLKDPRREELLKGVRPKTYLVGGGEDSRYRHSGERRQQAGAIYTEACVDH